MRMSKNVVAITATFDGSNILAFDEIKRNIPIPKNPPHVIVSIAVSSKSVVVCHKEQRFGIWVNKHTVKVNAAPSFCTIANTRAFKDTLSKMEASRHRVQSIKP